MPGVFEVSLEASIGGIVEDVLRLVDASDDHAWENQVRHLPLQ